MEYYSSYYGTYVVVAENEQTDYGLAWDALDVYAAPGYSTYWINHACDYADNDGYCTCDDSSPVWVGV